MAIEAPISKFRKNNIKIFMVVCILAAAWFAYDGYFNEGFIEEHTKDGLADDTLTINRWAPFPLVAGAILLAGYFWVVKDKKIIADENPLIFLNTCGSARICPFGVISFPEFFLKHNHSIGFLGTEINIPDTFASNFTKIFYYFFLQGYSLGEALYKTKWFFIEKYNNPLGILYTIYGNPNIRVKRKVTTVNLF